MLYSGYTILFEGFIIETRTQFSHQMFNAFLPPASLFGDTEL
jgi:hypothetical protein